MGHTVWIAIGIILLVEGDNIEEEYERILERLKTVVSVSSYFSKYSTTHEDFYFLMGKEGYDTSNKLYLFPSSSIIWSVTCDGSSGGYFHEGDGMENPDILVDRILTMKQDAQEKINDICVKLELPIQSVEVIRYSETYE
jgi:hypothetical protein